VVYQLLARDWALNNKPGFQYLPVVHTRTGVRGNSGSRRRRKTSVADDFPVGSCDVDIGELQCVASWPKHSFLNL
jgi:hypothetical protein